MTISQGWGLVFVRSILAVWLWLMGSAGLYSLFTVTRIGEVNL